MGSDKSDSRTTAANRRDAAPTAPADQTRPPDRASANPGDSPAGGDRQPITDADVPERPSLAPNVELSGQLQGSGFEEQQWLVLRDCRFIQLTEILYRILEQIDGQRTADEIAAGVARATGRGVSGENVRDL